MNQVSGNFVQIKCSNWTYITKRFLNYGPLDPSFRYIRFKQHLTINNSVLWEFDLKRFNSALNSSETWLTNVSVHLNIYFKLMDIVSTDHKFTNNLHFNSTEKNFVLMRWWLLKRNVTDNSCFAVLTELYKWMVKYNHNINFNATID